MFISRCLCSFHIDPKRSFVGPLEAELRSAGRVVAPAYVCVYGYARGSIQQSCVFVDLFRRALNLMALEVRCASRRLTLCNRVAIFDRFRELSLACLCRSRCLRSADVLQLSC
jgi:hypothetical protein